MLGSLFAAAQPALKIQSLQVAPSLPPVGPGSPEVGIATLVAQPSGFLAWLQNLFGAGKTSTLSVTNQRIMRVDQSSNTRDSVVMPLSRLSTFHYGLKKPSVGVLILGILLAVVGIPTVVLCLVGIALIASYFAGESYYMVFGGVGALGVTMKVKTKDSGELDRMCDLAWEAVKALDAGGGGGGVRAAPGMLMGGGR